MKAVSGIKRGEPVADQRKTDAEAESLTPLLLQHREHAAMRRQQREQGHSQSRMPA